MTYKMHNFYDDLNRDIVSYFCEVHESIKLKKFNFYN